MQDAVKSLLYAVRPRVLAKYLGLLALMLASLTLAPLLVSVGFGEYAYSKRYLAVIVLLLAAGLPALRLPHCADIQANESLAITALAFIIAPLIMTYPMMVSGLGFMDALFEAVSAVTTTGLSTVADVEAMPRTFLFARAWMQWYGGLGIVVLSVAILMNHHIALRRLVNPDREGMVTSTRVYARRVLVVYAGLTLFGFALVRVVTDDSFVALAHTMAAVSTGGFSPLNDSLAGLAWPGQVAVTLLGLCGAIPIILYYRLLRGGWRELAGDIEVRTLLVVTLLLSLLLGFSLATESGMAWREALRHGLLLGTSAQTTTGFAAMSPGQLSDTSLGVLAVAMLSGGAAGSTAGGFKVLRLLILVRLGTLLVRRSAMTSHAVAGLRLGDKSLEGDEIERSLLLILFFVAVTGISWLLFLGHGYDPMPALFEVASATGTVGLSSGLTSAELEPILKGVLCLDMLLGRVEIIALLVVLYPGTWAGKRRQ